MTTTSPGQIRHEHLVDIGLEGMPVDRTIEHHGSCDPVVAQPRHEGSGLPMAVRDPGSEALALRRPAAQPGHVGGGPRLVDEHEPGRIEIELAVEPLFPSAQNVRAVLLGRVGGLFLNVRPARSRKVQMVPTDTEMPASPRSRSCISAIVISGSASIRASR